jgi:hypothetical protein
MAYSSAYGFLYGDTTPRRPVMAVLYGEGEQIITWVPRSMDGRVTRVGTASYTILDLRNTGDDGTPLVLAGPTDATVDGAQADVSGAAGPRQADPTKIPVSNTAPFVEGRTYVVSEDGQREEFTLHAIGDGALFASADLARNYTDDAQVQGVQLQGVFPEGAADDPAELANGAGPFLAVWEYTIAGRVYTVPDPIWLTRYSLAPIATEADVITAAPGINRRLRGNGHSVSAAIRVAMEDYIAEIESAGRDPRYFITASAGKNAVRERALQYAHEWMRTGEDTMVAERHESRYKYLMRSLLNGRPDHGTVVIDRATNMAPPGTSKITGNRLFSRT